MLAYALGVLTGLGLAVTLAASAAIHWGTPTSVYLCFGDVWRRPRRVGQNVDDDFDRHHFRTCTNRRCWGRLCKYAHGVDAGARSWLWAHEVNWEARPKLWLGPVTLRRRHRVLYVPCPTKGSAKWLEDRLLARYQPPFNVAGVARANRHPRTAA